MGGFLFNGCGASDSYNKVQDIGEFHCKFCSKNRMFGLYELARKVRVIWIPTVTLNTKYAVICEKCKNGIYVEDDVRDAILRGKAQFEIGQDGIKIGLVGSQEQKPAVSQEETQAPGVGSAQPGSDEEPDYGEKGEQIFPHTESKPRLKDASVELFPMRKKVCRKCGLFYTEKKMNCDICGGELEQE